MTSPSIRDPFPGRKPRPYRAAIVAGGMIVFVVSLLGVWYSLPTKETASISEVVSAPGIKRAFVPFAEPRPVAHVTFEDGAGRPRSLADFRGKVVLLNVWATWCVPCRKEMPTLDRLQTQLGGADFEVVALSIDRDGAAVVRQFFDETNVHALGVYVDPTTEAQSKLEIIGVPTTLLLDRQGREVARYTGIAEWDRPEIIATIKRYLERPK